MLTASQACSFCAHAYLQLSHALCCYYSHQHILVAFGEPCLPPAGKAGTATDHTATDTSRAGNVAEVLMQASGTGKSLQIPWLLRPLLASCTC